MLDSGKKNQLRAAVRQAIKTCNTDWKFSCYDCRHCVTDDRINFYCELGIVSVLTNLPIVVTRLPVCFERNHVNSTYGKILEWMVLNGVDFYNAERGWATIVTRILKRTNYAGHFMNVRKDNLEKFSC